MDLKTFYKLSYGMYLVSSKSGEKINAQIANTVFQVSSEPPKIMISLNKENLTCEYVKESKSFGVGILSKNTPLSFIGHFGFKTGKEYDKFKDIDYFLGEKLKLPFPKENIIGYIEATVEDSMDVGTHIVFLGRVESAKLLKDEEVMTYAYYHEVKNGKSPKKAPTYIETKDIPKTSNLKKYECTLCGYIYDPEKGDPDNGIPPNTSFEDLPDDWVCPICGAGKEEFKEVK